ncbi:hypothetical protein [Hymenobacter arizonensis]|uniref:Outer membrane protein beta-barrel domain-containing protein n=1 Tax=Hymenobacter arizonensis TaxID=1227077 RepID=A0A1I6BA00_HYMAR|nr:hypothetical protein [Hymenobacter arizonensis]SFQ77744.1 hypothetical protein SAMN04515668_4334 [Hymenobacter arizonensis]
MHLTFTKSGVTTGFLFLLPLWLLSVPARGQGASLEAGLRFQKTLNLYYENGLTVQYRNPGLLSNRLQVGLTYVSSRLGSAIGSNAIKQDNVFLSGAYLFRMQRTVHPFVRANAGWFRADYESEIFKNLTNSSPTVSTELGVLVPTKYRFNAAASVGYNLITGDGSDSPGTLFPLFYQLSLTYSIFKPTAE